MAKNKNADNLTADFEDEGKKHGTALRSEFVEDESLTGDMTALEADDDVDESVREVGLYTDDDGNTPQELDLGGQIQRAENNRRGMD